MRRKDKEIIDIDSMESIIKRAKVCRIALSINDKPYIVPLNFGYKDKCLYFHSFPKGKKIDMIKQNNNVCFEMDLDVELKEGDNPCDYGMNYRSIIGFGVALLINDVKEKRDALNIIMDHYGESELREFNERMMKRVIIIKIQIESMTGKKSGY